MSLDIPQRVVLTLQRLESALDGLDQRLRILELSTADNLSCQRHEEPMSMHLLEAADFQKSVQKLRQLYEFDSQSSFNLPEASPAAFNKVRRTGNDEYSLQDAQNLDTDMAGYCRPLSSVYSSRSLSRLELDTSPVENPGKSSCLFLLRMRQEYLALLLTVPVFPDTPTSAQESSNTSPSSSASSCISTRSSDTQVTTPSSLDSTRRWSLDNEIKALRSSGGLLRGLWKALPTRSTSQSRRDASSRVVSQETPTALCYDDMKALSQGEGALLAKTDTRRQIVSGFGHELGRMATVMSRDAVARVQKGASRTGRALMNQQLRMLDNRE